MSKFVENVLVKINFTMVIENKIKKKLKDVPNNLKIVER